MPIQSVFGFFYRIGSTDYPINYDPNLPFGFNPEDESDIENAIFKYSVNDVEKALVACRTLVRRSFYDHKVNGELEVGANKSSDIMIVDSTGGYNAIVTEDISSDDWDAAFKAVEFLYNNQSKIFNPPTSNEYSCWGDEMLYSTTKPGSLEENLFHNNKYVKNSLSYTLSSNSEGLFGRLETVSFNVYFASTGTNILFRFYFDADAFVERSDNIAYKVYRYEDIEDPGNIISPNEMRDQVAFTFFDILHEGKYKEKREYFVDKRISDQDDFVREQFFIFSSLRRPIEDNIARLVVKQYLVDRYNNDMVYLRYTYPSLFDENEIHLIPMYDNFSTIINAQAGQDNNNLNLLYPININKLNTELLSFGFNISPNHPDYKPIEIFHVGPGSDWVPSSGSSFRYIFPILAVELDSESGITSPITARFPSYRPIYGSEEGGKAAEFHAILVSLFEYLLGVSPILDPVFMKEYDVIVYASGVSSGGGNNPVGINRERVSFTFNGDLWLLYGPLANAE
jgi:hypothetical protein